jgi:hypothetical protein
MRKRGGYARNLDLYTAPSQTTGKHAARGGAAVWSRNLDHVPCSTAVAYSKNSDPAAEAGMVLFTTTLGLYGGVLWSGELQGFIIHEMVPSMGPRMGPHGQLGC